MASKRDYYEILGVAKDTPKDQIKASYRKLALKYHPDKNKDAGAEERFKELSEAYAVLSDDEKRAAYDRFGHAGVDQRWNQEDIFRSGNFEDIFGDLGSIFQQFFGGGNFGGGFGPRSRRPQGPPPGEDLRMDVGLTLVEALKGTKKPINIRRPDRCATCKGTGAKPGTERKTCSTCRGTGQMQHATRSVFGSFVQVTTCRTCQGLGTELKDPCRDCGGEGRLMEPKSLEVEIPPGIEDGSRLRLSGEGAAGVQGGPQGDLYVFIHVEAHPRFQREGADLYTAVALEYPHLVLGDTITVDTLDGGVDLEIPAGTQAGARLRLKGQGMPHVRDPSRRGDLYVEVQLHVPTKPTKRAKELLEQLRNELESEEKHGWFQRRRQKDK